MKSGNGSRHLIFKTCIAAGFVLGIVLLCQTISTYNYVSGNLMVQAAQRDAEGKRASLQRATRANTPQENPNLAAILNDSFEEWKDEIAWLRIVDANGKEVAAAGKVPRSSTIALLGSGPNVRKTASGNALVTSYPFGTGRSRGMRLEIAVYLDSVSASFASLRQNLIVGVSASLALMGALIILALRFPKYLRGQQIQGQVELARRVQADLLPASHTESQNFEFAADCIPAGDVGGDFCDTFRIGGNRTAFVLGDVSGKRISAALLMALIHGAIQSMSWTRSADDHENASRSLNALLCKKTATERFSTLFWAYFDPKTSVLNYVNAGHLPPLLVRAGEFGNLEVMRLETGGPVLGLIPDAQYTQGRQEIRKGDLLVAFSDGIVEAPNFDSEEFGERRVLDAIREEWNESADSIRNAVLRHVGEFMNDEQVPDDQTIIVVRFKNAAVQMAAVQAVERGLAAVR